MADTGEVDWTAHLLADINPKLDGSVVPSPTIIHSSGRGGGRGESRGWGESSDDNASASSIEYPESRDGLRGRKGGGGAEAEAKPNGPQRTTPSLTVAPPATAAEVVAWGKS